MTILQVNTHDVGGGAEQIARLLHRGYHVRGHRSFLAVGVKHAQDDEHVFGIPYYRYPTLWQRVCWKLRRELTPRLAQRHAAIFENWLQTIETLPQQAAAMRGREFMNFPATAHLLELTPARPDILHCHNLHGNYFDVRTLPRYCRQLPVMLTLHDAWLLSGHCAHSFDCERWQTGCGHCPDLQIEPPLARDGTAKNWRRKQAIYRKSQLYIAAPSEWLMRRVRQSILLEAMFEGRVIPNGINLAVFHPADQQAARIKLGLPLDQRILLFTAYNALSNPFKDSLTLKKTMQILVDKFGKTQCCFLALGKVNECSDDDEIVHKIPYQRDASVVATYYQAADIYIHAAKADTFPNVVLEALACGLPVVATAVGGIPEQIDHERTGFLVPPGDAAGMAEAIQGIFEHDALRHAMSQQAVEMAQRRFEKERMVEDYIGWYQEILEHAERERRTSPSYARS